MAAITRTPRSRWIEEGLLALAAGGPDAVRVEVLAQALGVTSSPDDCTRPAAGGCRPHPQ